MQSLHEQSILILDFGSQYTQLIARRIREIGVYCEIYAWDVDPKAIEAFAADGIILSGGPESVNIKHPPQAPEMIFELGRPVLGICYGMQTIAKQLGGEVVQAGKAEFGYAKVKIRGSDPLFENIEDRIDENGLAELDVWMSHGDHVVKLPVGFESVSQTDNAQFVSMFDAKKQLYGLQFHPEVTHTPQGKRILERFVLEICGCQANWTTKNIIDESIDRIQKQVGKAKVILGLSGGVDSAVVAALLHRAIGQQLICVFVDTGLLRLNEGDQVMQTFAKHLGANVIRVNAAEKFYTALQGLTDPEAKRKITGKMFIQVFSEVAQQLKDVKYLAQGTIYPDVIESAASQTGKAHVIKSHHNVGGLPENLNFELIEPLRELFKDEVRQLGLALGLPSEMVHRHPFPGPGLAIRILAEVKPAYVDILRQADAIFIEELKKQQLYAEVSQAFAVFLPVKSVGVTGDGRRYDFVIALRAVKTIDFMTAEWAKLPYAFLDLVSQRIVNEIPQVSRVVYDISGKPPATIEWE